MRPNNFDEFVGQAHIKNILQTAIHSSQLSSKPLGHTLFAGKSGFGKTTLATITAHQLHARIKIITGYAVSKPSELISLLNLIQAGDVLFIDEIHRLRAPVEEVLYTAMEDYCVDMIMPDGHHIRLPVEPFTLIGATTKLESLSEPLKNRFVYHFYMEPYTIEQKKAIIARYLTLHDVETSNRLITTIAEHIPGVPRQIANFCHQLHDRLITHNKSAKSELHHMSKSMRSSFRSRTALKKGGLTPLHQRYLEILHNSDGSPVGLKTISAKLGMSEKSIESDIEPLLFELEKIEKTTRGRVLQ